MKDKTKQTRKGKTDREKQGVQVDALVIKPDTWKLGKPREWWALKEISDYLKTEAMFLGRFPNEMKNALSYDKRYRLNHKPFRCFAYNDMVRRINRLEKIIKKIEEAL